MDKISVIVPAYNAEKTIEKCISSILNQTYSNLEVIVINDGSTDNTLDILESIQKSDDRVNIFTIENEGVSHARNVGIDKANGDLITFVDSDDYIDEDMYSTLVGLFQKYDVDIAHCSYKNVENGKVVIYAGNNDGQIILQSREESLSNLISGKMFAGGNWNKLYRKDLFNDLRFDEKIKFNEDVLLNYHLFKKSKCSVYIDKAYYNYFVNLNSATHSGDSVVFGENCKYVADSIEKDSQNTVYNRLAKYKKAYSALVLYRAYLYSKDKSLKNKKKKLLKEIKTNKKQGLYTGKNDKISVFLFCYFPHLYCLFYKFYDKVRVKQLDPT
jgi:glycosyltransferase involved in cell wall biosynthesis